MCSFAGFFTILGRNKDLIITGGLNVYPKEIEDVLDEIEGVSESTVIGDFFVDLDDFEFNVPGRGSLFLLKTPEFFFC